VDKIGGCMNLFYFDGIIKKYDEDLAVILLIEYLEKKYNKEKDLQALITLIGYSWYYFVEGGLLLKTLGKDELNSTLFFLQSKWKKYTELGLQEYSNKPELCYIIGYTLGLDWFVVDQNYGDNRGIQLMRKCYDITTNENLKSLAKNFLDNSPPNSKHKKLDNAKYICAELFPSDSELDKFFREIFIAKI
jgi:hypothetical protein